MCLSTVDKELPRYKRGKGWKVFRISSGGDLKPQYDYVDIYTYGLDKWYRSTNGKIEQVRLQYETGFHVFTRKKDAIDWHWGSKRGVAKVEYKEVVASGEQHGKKVVVAKQMMIPSGPDGLWISP